MNFSHVDGGRSRSYDSGVPSPSQLTTSLLTTSRRIIASNSSQSTHCALVLISTTEAFQRCLGISAAMAASCRCSSGSP